MESKEEGREPVSPTGQYFSSSVLNISILAVLESEIPIDDSLTMSLLTNVFLPINPRFSSIMIADDRGVKQWKRVNVELKDHINIPIFPDGLSSESYDVHLQDYLTKLAMDELPLNRPLWEIHIIKYPTSNAAGTLVFKLHHSLGDGFSLMGALFSCFQRADDPSLPLTFPTLRQESRSSSSYNARNMFMTVPRYLSLFVNTTWDFIFSILKSSVIVDDLTPIKSGTEGVEFLPITISTVTFSLDQIKKIKAKIGGTVNDVIVGTVFHGSRLYMQAKSKGTGRARSTALVLLNTRQINGYRSIEEMTKANAESPWGNQFAFLPVSIPQSTDAENEDPLKFVLKAKKIMNRKKNSLAVFFTGRFLEMMRKFRGPEVSAGIIYSTLKNTSMAISNVIGPTEQIALADHPCKGMYYMVVTGPQSIMITMISYMGKLRVAVGAEKEFIDHQLFTSCLENAFERIFKAAIN